MSELPENVTSEFIARQLQELQQGQRAHDRALREVAELARRGIEYTQRVERRMDGVERRVSELRDDLELMIKAELMGRLEKP
ncbi:hypothetical protein D3874_20395 [Oleomonas cavernae]|uniref:Uncharacterized protein n=1 Tax=Oleomonas cavernae TaxID=2320859 RepID=A0A418WGA2_9PROT|nr:hypothetical protein [Oleomonas cavernae]RJF89043.1 hypothetical protein D3874_20395 [Oleomonas cavernae]